MLVTFKVSMNKTPVPPPGQLDHGWSRRLYPGDVQRVREADCISGNHVSIIGTISGLYLQTKSANSPALLFRE